MDKRFENMRLANVAHLNKLATFAAGTSTFNSQQVAKILGCNSVNATKFLNRYSDTITRIRNGRNIVYSFNDGVLSNFNAEAIVNKALHVKGYTKKHLSVSPDKQEIEKLKKQNSKLQDEIKYLKSQLESFEHLKICLKNILA